MIVKLLTDHHLECLSLEGGCRGSSESTHVKMPHCWKYHALAHIISVYLRRDSRHIDGSEVLQGKRSPDCRHHQHGRQQYL